MSYQLTIVVTDGTPVIGTISGTIPDGDFSLSGHEDPGSVSVGVARRNPDGTQVAVAQSFASKAGFPVEVTK